jgi:DNA (cytosine-5)-methyltransferase 1
MAARRGQRGLRVAGLFAGIGGLELGLARAGHETALLCEIEPGAGAVLRRRFPRIPFHEDITTLDRLPKGTELVAAGFPCQDLSQAGQTRGIRGRQSSLVDHVFRLLREGDVPWVLLENVPFMLQLGRGAAIRHVVSEFEALGYSWAYRVIDTRAFGIPQRRERVYFLASKVADPSRLIFEGNVQPEEPNGNRRRPCGFFWTEGLRGLGWAVDAVPTLKGGSTVGIPSPPAIWMPDGSFVTPDIRDAERLQGFDADWTLPAAEVVRGSHRWKLVGNAVSVPVAEWIGRRILGAPGARPPLAATFDPEVSWPRAAYGVDGNRFSVRTSTWPIRVPAVTLRDFLEHPTKPLSKKALEGFWSRLSRSSLNRPEQFDRDIQRTLGIAVAMPGRVSRATARRGAVRNRQASGGLFGE